MSRTGFVLAELIIGIVILGVIGVGGSKMLLSIQKHHFIQKRFVQMTFGLENALDMMGNYLLEAQRDSIVYGNNFLSWKMKDLDLSHQIYLQEKRLYFDEFLALEEIENFNISRHEDTFRLELCSRVGKKYFCAQRLYWLWEVRI
ncbi:hypothetical protein [Helicobacter sp. 11S03491-1]|uniref:hypothetical protein n=1 Tax=Helicobacter sp. 11S03491-1 TaxID=1476196 RepID=UPI000BA6D2B6|nr:hypothetical protein [Helicobacter sp. 11S03491-1]PAF42937.1 hypothetical protein BKH45_02395 [Helicobacter sp. 11S03491-1]